MASRVCRGDLVLTTEVVRSGARSCFSTAISWMRSCCRLEPPSFSRGWDTDTKLGDRPYPWPDKLAHWWSALPLDTRTDALFALWHGVRDRDWLDAPSSHRSGVMGSDVRGSMAE